jgi:hypothetical protein
MNKYIDILSSVNQAVFVSPVMMYIKIVMNLTNTTGTQVYLNSVNISVHYYLHKQDQNHLEL